MISKILSDNNINYHIIGGTARDYYYKTPPRDIDYWVRPLNMERFRKLMMSKGYTEKAHEDKSFVDKWITLFQRDNNDILVAKSGLKETIDRFDANINQFAIINHQIKFLGDYHPDEYGLVILDKNLPEHRINHLKEICDRLKISY
ncbi:nucleotidyltransferase [Proteus phage phiP4-3]|uniref:Nucleotidyltransferase n=1 Tax=Proteus phage phiP4-3 TaxID=2065203 RepID=A0A2I6PF59_9CAUD|nr:nucleotidyltransferase [Proteus phage phiP4-3]AUM58362.1 hypothetical protein phiP43_006 [Proteus phage phiP4-3]